MNPEFDAAVRAGGVTLFCGVDEAGRGPRCGPGFGAAGLLSPPRPLAGLNDSKKLSEAKREALFDVICEQAVAYGIGSASVEEIEEQNILRATFLAMRRAVEALGVTPELALVDGNQVPPAMPAPVRTVVKGDALSESIAAASVLAKVSRDRELYRLDALYPQYGFAKHKGYGTAAHYAALRQYGPSPVHRMSFLRKFLEAEGTR